MKRFLARLSFFAVLFFVLALVTDRMISTGLSRSRRQPLSSWNDIYHGRIDADLIVSGSSRAFVHVSPRILEEVTGWSTYNLGMNGYHFPMQRVRIGEYRKHNRKPRILVQTLDITQFHRRSGLFQYEQFLPHFNQAPMVATLSKYEGYNPLDPWLPMFRYRGRDDLLQEGLQLLFRPHPSYDSDRGYRANDWRWDGAFDEFKNRNQGGYFVAIEPEVVSQLDDFVADLKAEEIQPMFAFTPEYIEAQKLCTNRDQVFAVFQRIAAKHGIPFLDYSDHPICHDRSLFYNSQHLNRTGAEQFSRQLALDLESIFDQNFKTTKSMSVTQQ